MTYSVQVGFDHPPWFVLVWCGLADFFSSLCSPSSSFQRKGVVAQGRSTLGWSSSLGWIKPYRLLRFAEQLEYSTHLENPSWDPARFRSNIT